ncbi:ABC transporter substrate-binding protein [Arthrobacter roseus]|uniref:ABC transporter substrate-binding protein n=1 Tax=Arthrobacter roseus TaxID=136274 RepID=UPI0019640D5A|nr:ABC transporter substrate-binding protein [Arthrobacter roseus]MBM7847763.1 putative ABC transport system substrate-binding protein [Arthrobacter roseus]
MKRTAKSIFGAGLLTAALALTACGGSDDAGQKSAEDKPVQIGITQIVEHDALNAAREGFKKALKENGYEDAVFDEQNAQGDQATATTIASKFASDKKDLILAIATPTAQAAAQSIQDIPILITAVTEPEEAGLVDSWEEPGANLTGTSDLNPVEKQLGLITELAPDAKSIGVVYSSGEVNSEVQVELARQAAKKMGLELKEATVTNSSEVQQAANSLDVDVMYVPTDNVVVSALKSVVQVAESKKMPLIVADTGSVEGGGIATYGIDYEKLGYQTGMMAIKVLEGEDPATMPIETLEEVQLILNPAAAKRMGVTIPDELLEKADQVIK